MTNHTGGEFMVFLKRSSVVAFALLLLFVGVIPAFAQEQTAAIQGTVRAIWETHGLDRETAQGIGWHYTRIGNPIGKAQVSREGFAKPKWTLR